MKKTFILSLLLLGIFALQPLNAQWDPIEGCIRDTEGNCLPNTILTAVPFLRIVPDSRSGSLGDAGLAISPDANAMHFNASKLAFVENDMSFSATYTPWLQNLGIQDVYLAYLTGYKRIDENQTVGGSLRFFSLGELEFRDENGMSLGTGRPREFELAFAYARKLAENFSASLTTKYIYSNLAGGQTVNSLDIFAANSFAVDLGLNYIHDLTLGDLDGEIRYGLALTNLGAKVSYTRSADERDFIPANIGLGTAYTMNIDDYNSLTFALDFNKLMVPTPTSKADSARYDVKPADGRADFRQKGLFDGMLGSFGDAPGGFSEELQEVNISFGIEYWYAKQFAVRTGYYYESARKGNRKYLTAGFGIKYNVFEMNFSYLVPTNNRQNPLDNTLRFSLIFNVGDTE